MRRRDMRTGSDAGAAAVEFAIVVPLLLALILGMIEFGFMFQAQLAVTHAAREGARLAGVGQYSAASVVDRAYPLTPAGGLVISGPTEFDDGAGGTYVQVTLTYPYAPALLPIGPVVNLSSTARMRVE